jgi:hypothetical protein
LIFQNQSDYYASTNRISNYFHSAIRSWLRKIDGKNYVTVIDFIGNYENNYLIPIALYGDTSYNKDSLRKLITEGSRMIPGSSTINFDEITKENISIH